MCRVLVSTHIHISSNRTTWKMFVYYWVANTIHMAINTLYRLSLLCHIPGSASVYPAAVGLAGPHDGIDPWKRCYLLVVFIGFGLTMLITKYSAITFLSYNKKMYMYRNSHFTVLILSNGYFLQMDTVKKSKHMLWISDE